MVLWVDEDVVVGEDVVDVGDYVGDLVYVEVFVVCVFFVC